jgi:putative MATE family efflux protein
LNNNAEVNITQEPETKQPNNLLEGSIAKTIYLVAAPTMIQMFLETSYHIIDAFWIGMIGPVALAAVASASFLLWMIFSCCALIEVGVNSLVAKYYGAGDPNSVNKTGVYGIRYGILISVFISIIGIPAIEPVYNLMGLQPDVIDSAICFIIPCLIGLPFYTVGIACYAIFRGTGDSKTPLKILASTLIFNAVLAPLLIFGTGPFPELGIAGGAISTLIAELIATFISLIILKKKKLIVNIEGKFFEKDTIIEITKIGAPIAINGVIFCIVYLFLTRIISQFGTAPVAALGIGHRVESLGYCISVGFSIAATTLVGQNTGAKNYKRANAIAWQINWYATEVMLVISILILIFRKNIAGLFTEDPAVIIAASGYLMAIGYTEIFLALEIVMEGVFSGKGNTLPFTLIGLPLNILRVPVAFLLADIYGIDGVWWTIGFSTALKGILLVLWFKLTENKGLQPSGLLQ